MLKNLGVSLSLVGVPLAMYLNHYLPYIDWTPLLMSLSFVLLVNIKNLRFGLFSSFHKIFIPIFIFQVITLLIGIAGERITPQYISFHLYILLMITAYSTIIDFNFSDFLKVVFIFSGLCSLMGIYSILTGLVGSQEYWFLLGDEDFKLELFTVSYGSLINLFSSMLLFRSSKSIWKLIAILFIALDFYIFIIVGKRTPLIVGLISLIFYFYFIFRSQVLKIKFSSIIIIIVIFLCAFYSIYLFSIEFYERINLLSLNVYNGFLNILGDTSVSDTTGSAIARVESRRWTFNFIDENFSFFNYLFGYGYMTKWIDNPILQSYLDFGVPGIFFYFIVIIWFPFTKVFLRQNTDLQFFGICLCMYALFSAFSSGNPYMQIKYIPIIFLAWSYRVNRLDFV